MRFIFILLVATIHCTTSMKFDVTKCSNAVTNIIEASTLPCTDVCQDNLRTYLRDMCSWSSNQGEPCMTVTATATHTPLVVTITPTCSPLLVASSLATRAPKCPTTDNTEYSSITPTNCLQSTQSKEMSTTVETVITNTATGDTNDSPVILGAFIAVLAALLVAVTTGWIVTCVLNTRKDKALTTSNKDNALQNPVYDSQHIQRYQGNPSARIQTGYSSQGPTYEQVRVNTGTNYDDIDRRGSRPQTTPPDQDYSTLDSDEQEHDYHVLESTNAGGPTAVGGQEPQDYEIPLRKI